ncbi:MAG: T9SS C-terminal target domain-containing protein [Calditrichaeota bacterium]|nr:MAG: T9SS C-terminal target domain-containing protein [Calditrichota bacterium]MBL1206956.1 T9SS C-terminal target domain-containing protein [Calditrichota bacterium]NOG46783.1 T9SS type A sorting domain-containing protein [Calditrichota bacterium]
MTWILSLFLMLLSCTYLFSFENSPQKTSAIPAGYYDSASGLTGTSLKSALHYIINDHTRYPYTSGSTDVWDILMDTDEDTTNSSNVILLYTGRSQAKTFNSSGNNDPDAWNREHTWPKSHGFPSENDTAYTDVHHLRPTDASVNSDRGNKDFDNGGSQHSEATGCFTDSDSWEPRDEVKGDVARMIFYMAVRYENDGNYDLEMSEVIPTSGPNLAKESVLLQWHADDPPDAWEKQRHEKIYSYQNNRNPFIDHPEYATDIWGGAVIKAEPSNHPTSFSATGNGLSIDLSWTDATGAVLPDKYLIKASSSGLGAISDPVDGTAESSDADLSDGTGSANVSQGTQSYSFSGLSATTTYYFKIYSYTNSGANIDYKTDATVQTASATTGTTPSVSDLFISEYIEGLSNNKYLEIYNGTGSSVNLSGYDVQIFYNGSSSAGNTISLSGTVAHDDVFVIANSLATFWGGTPDQTSNDLTFNGNDVVVLRESSVDLDKIGVVGETANLYKDKTLRRKSSVSDPVTVYDSAEWDDLAITYSDLGQHTSDSSLPVELVSFLANFGDGQILLTWKTASEINNLGFIIMRKEGNSPEFEVIASFKTDDGLVGLGTSSIGGEYYFTDSDIFLNEKYSYQLWDVSYDGASELNAEIDVESVNKNISQFKNHILPKSTILYNNFPNPFNPTTKIGFDLVSSATVQLDIFDISGKHVKNAFRGFLNSGSYETTWNGKNDSGQLVSSGIYIYKLTSNHLSLSKRMLLLR